MKQSEINELMHIANDFWTRIFNSPPEDENDFPLFSNELNIDDIEVDGDIRERIRESYNVDADREGGNVRQILLAIWRRQAVSVVNIQ